MNKHVSVRIDEELLEKLHVVSDYEGRSINRHILVLIRKDIEQYEKNTAKSKHKKTKQSCRPGQSVGATVFLAFSPSWRICYITVIYYAKFTS